MSIDKVLAERGNDMINWNEAPEWADCIMKNTATGDTEFGVLCGGIVYRNSKKSIAFNINENAPDYWYLSARRLVGHVTNNKDKPESTHSRSDELSEGDKYVRTIYGLCGTAVQVDIYRVLDAYPTGDAALDHAVKKALCAGLRGHKDKITDYENTIESMQKALILLKQKQANQ